MLRKPKKCDECRYFLYMNHLRTDLVISLTYLRQKGFHKKECIFINIRPPFCVSLYASDSLNQNFKTIFDAEQFF